MKKHFKVLIPLAAVLILTSCAAQPRLPGRQSGPYGDNDDRYENDRYGNDRYGNDRYGNNRYGNNWVELGSKRLNKHDDYEKININGYRNGGYSQLRFDTYGPVTIYRAVVRYDNGRTEEVNVRNAYNNRGRNTIDNNSVIVNLPRSNRAIRQVMFWYDADSYYRNNRNKSMVSVFGRW